MCFAISILSSTVLATIISSIVTYLNYNKELRLKRITDERTKWRENIRNIANNINESNNEKEIVLSELTKLKLLINTNGLLNKEDYLKDGHIWSLIKEIEADDRIDCKKIECLILYLSALLKHDWERTKIESSAFCKKKKLRIINNEYIDNVNGLMELKVQTVSKDEKVQK